MDLRALEEQTDHVASAPRDDGAIHHLCVRPHEGERRFVQRLEMAPELGVIGDRWLHHTWMHLADGSPDPRLQVCILQKRVLDLFWTPDSDAIYSADNLIADMNLGDENLPVGARLQLGSAVVEVSDVFNNACAKWRARYGDAALRWVNLAHNRRHRLRGIYCRVVQAGVVEIRDTVRKISSQ